MLQRLAVLLLALSALRNATAAPESEEPRKRSSFAQDQPIDDSGKGGPILGTQLIAPCACSRHRLIGVLYTGGTNKALDLQNPDNLGQQSTDNGVVPNLKWSFSDSKTRILKGGWVREQVIQDLPQSHDIAAAQQHLKKGAIRELHWHRVVRKHAFMSGNMKHGSQSNAGTG